MRGIHVDSFEILTENYEWPGARACAHAHADGVQIMTGLINNLDLSMRRTPFERLI
jgi:hypothetical protein